MKCFACGKKNPIRNLKKTNQLNKDNKISKEEFIKHHEDMFAAMDTNKDGFLDESEMHHMMDQMHGKHGKSNHGHHGESDHKHSDHGKEKSK